MLLMGLAQWMQNKSMESHPMYAPDDPVTVTEWDPDTGEETNYKTEAQFICPQYCVWPPGYWEHGDVPLN